MSECFPSAQGLNRLLALFGKKSDITKCKMFAPHYKDKIAGLQQWPFLAGFWPFRRSFFIVTHIYEQTLYILKQKLSPHVFS